MTPDSALSVFYNIRHSQVGLLIGTKMRKAVSIIAADAGFVCYPDESSAIGQQIIYATGAQFLYRHEIKRLS